MLIEAAKGGHTTVVSVLIDYNPMGSVIGNDGNLAAAVDNAATLPPVDLERIPGEGQAGQSSADVVASGQQPGAAALANPSGAAPPLPNKNNR